MFTVPLENARPGAYLDLDKERRDVRCGRFPSGSRSRYSAELSLIVEYYSR